MISATPKNLCLHSSQKGLAVFTRFLLLLGLPFVAIASETEEEQLDKIRVEYKLPAISAAVVTEGKVIKSWSVGLRKWNDTDAVKPDDRWHFGSCGKSMTASIAALLVEEGLLRWDMPLHELLPSQSTSMQPEWRVVTLEHLLYHQSGAPDKSQTAKEWRNARKRLEQPPIEQRKAYVGEILANHKPTRPPGTHYEYSNTGYAIVGHAIEMLLGKPWEEIVRERLAIPLGMKTVGFGPPAASGAQPWGHIHSWLGGITPVPPDLNGDNPPALASAGTLHCSIEDFALYAAWHLRGGQGKGEFLTPDTFKKLHTPYPGSEYAMGWVTVSQSWGGGMVLTHGGSNTNFYAVTTLAPKKETAVVVATNIAGAKASKALDDAASLLLRKYLPKNPAKPSATPKGGEDLDSETSTSKTNVPPSGLENQH